MKALCSGTNQAQQSLHVHIHHTWMRFEGTGARHPLSKTQLWSSRAFLGNKKMKPSLRGSFINHHNTGFQTSIFISPLGPSQDQEEVHSRRDRSVVPSCRAVQEPPNEHRQHQPALLGPPGCSWSPLLQPTLG